MAMSRSIVTWACLAMLGSPTLGGDAGPIVLRETPLRPDEAASVIVEMSAQGTLRPAPVRGQPEPKPVPLKVESRFAFTERPWTGRAGPHMARKVDQAAVAINSADRPRAGALRPEVSFLIAEPGGGGIQTFSPGGPLTRNELDLVQGPADPLTWPGLLPAKPVAVGETWPIGTDAARSLSDYEALASNTVRAKLESADEATARIRLAGQVQGAARGGEGTLTLDGFLTYDRKRSRISRLELSRRETRTPGQVEAGLDFQGTLQITREPAEVPAELSDAILGGIPTAPSAGLRLLQFSPPEGRYTLLHDRDWHTFWDDARLSVLKRLDRGELVAQCNISVGPNAGAGRHQEPAQFREDIRKALGTRFVAFLDGGEIDRDGYGYKVAVQGREGEQDVLWYYYLLASPDGEQLLITFTLNAADAERFGNQDAQLVGSLQWAAP